MTDARKNYLREEYDKLDNEINNLFEDYFEDITTKLFYLFNNIDNLTDDNIEEIQNNIIDLIYSYIEEIYNITLKAIKRMYKKVNKNINTNNLHPYNKDGKTLENRISEWINNFITGLNQGSLNIKNSSVNVIERILKSEGQTAKNQILKEKVGTLAEFVVIESNSEDGCGEYDGEYPIMEIPEGGPPFHPNCQCNMYYDYTDQEDEIEDLELEDDEKEEI